jgi:hypothetical protein
MFYVKQLILKEGIKQTSVDVYQANGEKRVLDVAGVCPTYGYVVTDGVLVWTRDGMSAINDPLVFESIEIAARLAARLNQSGPNE